MGSEGGHEQVRAWGQNPGWRYHKCRIRLCAEWVKRECAAWEVKDPTETLHFSRNEVRTECAQLQSSLTVTSTKHLPFRSSMISFPGPCRQRLPRQLSYIRTAWFSLIRQILFFLRRWLVWEEHPNHCIQPINPKSQINNEQ